MELRPTNGKPSEDRQPTDSFGQPANTQEDSANFGIPPSDSSKAHYRADTDSNQQALHHTLGPGRNQAASGSHTHDGTTSPKLGLYKFDTTVGQEGKIIPSLVVTGSKGGNAALASLIAMLKNFIDFTDTTT